MTTAVFNSGMTSPTAAPLAAHTAVSTYSDSRPSWRTRRGREPRRAQTRVSVPFWPNRASSWCQTSTSSSGCCSAIAAICSTTISLKNSWASGCVSGCCGRGIRSL